MNVVLRGVRGNIAAPEPETAFYGGNTACVETRTNDGTLLFLDAGTGIRRAGAGLPDSGEAHLFITHGHADHIVGLWFFKPIHSPDWTTHLYLPDWLNPLPDWFYRLGLFPVPFERLRGRVIRHDVSAGETLRIDSETGASPVCVDAFTARHPGGCLGYRVRADGAAFVYTGDHEITADPEIDAGIIGMLRGADLAVVDAQYNRDDYQPGFGHSAWEYWMEATRHTGLRQLVFTHHCPDRSDEELRKLDETLRSAPKNGHPDAAVAREGCRFTLGA